MPCTCSGNTEGVGVGVCAAAPPAKASTQITTMNQCRCINVGLLFAHDGACSRCEAALDAAKEPVRESLEPTEQTQLGQVVKNGIENGHGEQRQQQAQRL